MEDDDAVGLASLAPGEWSRRPLKYLTRFMGGATPSKDEPAYWNGDIPWVSPKDMKSAEISDAFDHITVAGLANCAARIVPAGSVLLVVRSGILRHTLPVAISTREVAINQDMKALVPGQSLHPKFLRYFLIGGQRSMLEDLRKQGATVESIEHSYLANTVIAFPSFPEQESIVRYLDREVAKSEELIREYERLSELLTEKRAVCITHAVTKGLDPSVPIQETHLEYVGEIPRHWVLTPLKYVVNDLTVGIVVTPAAYYASSGVPCLRSLNISECSISDEDLVYISDESNEFLKKSKIFEGDIVIVRTGQPGTAAVVDSRFDGANCIDLIIARKSPRVSPEFLAYYLNSNASKIQYELESGGALQQHFNVGVAGSLAVCLPPLAEQISIVKDLGVRCARFDELISGANEAITLMKERQASLIAASVTGNIDVKAALASQAA
jgi:type I restriction enzyme S subunit